MYLNSIPGSESYDDPEVRCALSILSGIVCGAAERPTIADSGIRRQFAADFVAQPQSGIDVGQARADMPRRIGRAVKIEFRLGLKNPLLGQQQIVEKPPPPRRSSAVADIGGRLDVEKIRCQPL